MKTTRNLITGTLLMTAMLGTTATAAARDYFGLSLNDTSKAQAIEVLKARKAVFEADYGYKGYGKDLPSIKINADTRMGQYGQLEEAWLNFTPDKRLYKISITWADAGKTYRDLRDILDQKYGLDGNAGQGFVKRRNYRDGKVSISLIRNTFGFGDDQRTTLVYDYKPARAEVQAMKQRIDQHIKRQKLKNAGDNL